MAAVLSTQSTHEVQLVGGRSLSFFTDPVSPSPGPLLRAVLSRGKVGLQTHLWDTEFSQSGSVTTKGTDARVQATGSIRAWQKESLPLFFLFYCYLDCTEIFVGNWIYLPSEESFAFSKTQISLVIPP